MDEGIGDTLVSVDATRGVVRSNLVFSRLESWAAVATVTDPQSRLVGPGKASINSSSSTQSSAASLACSGPNNSVTALMKARNSRSAKTIRFASAGLWLFFHSYSGIGCRSLIALTIAIKPEKCRQTNWTKVLVDVPSGGASPIAGRSQGRGCMPPDQYQSLIDVGFGEVHATHEACREETPLPRLPRCKTGRGASRLADDP